MVVHMEPPMDERVRIGPSSGLELRFVVFKLKQADGIEHLDRDGPTQTTFWSCALPR